MSSSHDSEEESPSYKRKNKVQINKVRMYIREIKYLLSPKEYREHVSLDKIIAMSTDLVSFSAIAVENIKQYIDIKQDSDLIRIRPVYVTKQQQSTDNFFENKTTSNIQELIFQKIELLQSSENQKLQEEIYNKTVRNKKKANYIEFYYKLCEVINEEDYISNAGDDEEN